MTIHLAWLIASWLTTSIVGGVIGAFGFGVAVGRWRSRIEGEIESARKSRESIHREIDRIGQRLERGDGKFDQFLERVAGFGGQLDGLTDDIRELRTVIRDVVTHEECNRRHWAASSPPQTGARP